MKRKIYNSLLDWKRSPTRKPMVMEGARQVGKTHILKEFGKLEYDNMVYINCQNNPFANSLFEQDFDMERILRNLAAYSRANIIAGKTLIFFDEVQEAPRCLEALKYFCEDAREQHVVTAGSLLGIVNHKDVSYPVGKIDTLHLYPMSFEEFLWAKNEYNLADALDSCDWQTITPLAQKLEDLLRQYYYVGGMPEVVKMYIGNQDLRDIREKQMEILNNYDRDFSKHAGNEAPRIRMVWKSLPSQLAKENKKFVYGAIKKGARAKEFEEAIQWLIDAGLVYKVSRCKNPTIPLSIYEDSDAFKLFALDVGLLGAHANMPAELMLINNNVFKEVKGAFTENFVMQQLVNRWRKDLGIYYFKKENSLVEIDFLVQVGEKVIPMEVKAEENVRSKSLKTFITNEYPEKKFRGLRCSMKGYINQGWMENIPLYAVGGFFDNI
ncbi:MAG: ATP-binding protein [Prevotella sp.]|nr:ATP-binding protein [Prevotella sp.]